MRIPSALTILLLAFGASAAWAGAQTALDDSLREGHDIFLIVTEPQAQGIDSARELARKAAGLAPQATVVEMNRLDPENAALVARFRLSAAPVPLILVIAKNGVAAGGALPARTTPEQLAALIPTPKKAEYLKALDEGRAVFLVLSRPDMPTLPAVTQTCEAAHAKMNQDAEANVKVGDTKPKDQATVLGVTLTDPAEQRFLAEMKADPRSGEPWVVVVNTRGQTTRTFLGSEGLTVEALVEATKKRVSECCPGGRCK
jgi:hypothetical protein